MIPLPANSCVYNHFDLETLEPLNTETKIRRLELDLIRIGVAGRRVIDIGCNNGYLTLQCAIGGALHVTAIDVREEFLTYVREAVEQRGLQGRVEVLNFDFKNLDTSRRAEVVFFLEVLHWTTSQGLPIADAIRKLWELTSDTLVIEFPWSVSEPSIRAQTNLKADEYDSRIVFKWLTYYFTHVEVVAFNEYFGGQSGSCRSLVIAREPKVSPAIQIATGEIGRIEKCIRNNRLWLTYSGSKPYAVKRLGKDASLQRIPSVVLSQLFETLGRGSRFKMVALQPDKQGIFVHPDPRDPSSSLILYEWVGSTQHSEIRNAALLATTEAVVEVARELSLLCAEVLHGDAALWVSMTAREEYGRLLYESESMGVATLPEFSTSDWSLGHGDLHHSNVLWVDGSNWVIDPENFWIYPLGFDVAWALILCVVTDRVQIQAALLEVRTYERNRRLLLDAALRFALKSWKYSFGQRDQGGIDDLTKKVEQSYLAVHDCLRLVGDT